MQSFSLINNALMKRIDSIARSSEPEKPLKNTLKTIIKSKPVTNYAQGSLYSRRFTFDISRSYDNLAQLYIKCILSTGTTVSTVETYFATKVFKEITLRTKAGTVLQTLTPSYISARVDELFETEIYSHLKNGIEPDSADFSASVVTCFVPMFFFFSESENTFLNTRDLEPLEIECVVNDNKEAMGMDQDLTSAEFELFALYHDIDTSNKNSELLMSKKNGIPRVLTSSYKVFYEDIVDCVTNSTSTTLLLRCPHPSFVLHMSLVASNSKRAQIKTASISIAGVPFLELDYRINYQFYGKNKAYLENGTVSIFFNSLKSRSVDSGLLLFSGPMFPTILTVTHDAIDAGYSLNVFEEYRTNFKVSDTGVIHLSDDMNNLDQSTSSGDKVNLLG